MAIISVSNIRQGYQNSQIRYAITYAVITLAVLLFLNVYCNHACQRIFYQNKESALVEKCQLAANEIGQLEVLNPSSVSSAVAQMGSLKVTRLIITDAAGIGLYDSRGEAVGGALLLPEIMKSLEGNDVFSWNYQDGAMMSRAAVPVDFYGVTLGCVYMTEFDTEQGSLIAMLQRNIFTVTCILELAVVLFSAVYSTRFSLRMRTILESVKTAQAGSLPQKVTVGGNDELTVLASEFNLLSERLSTSEQKRSRFVSDASHELKTPLASIKLLTDSILQNDMDTDTMREFVQDIGNEADRLTRMSGKLLSLARVDGDIPDQSELIYMAPTVKRVAKMLSAAAQSADVTVTLETDFDTTILVLEDDFYQIVFNLMENGIKYNRPGGTLRVCLSQQGDTAVLRVADSGMGIPEEAKSHIFERFYRVDKARSRASGGSGLGLAIVSAIVKRNRGTIEVESQLDVGTTFYVRFPVFEAEVDRE